MQVKRPIIVSSNSTFFDIDIDCIPDQFQNNILDFLSQFHWPVYEIESKK
jgi:hypothetical protein